MKWSKDDEGDEKDDEEKSEEEEWDKEEKEGEEEENWNTVGVDIFSKLCTRI